MSVGKSIAKSPPLPNYQTALEWIARLAPPENLRLTETSSRGRAALEIVLLIAGLEAVLWTNHPLSAPLFPRILIVVATLSLVGWLVYTQWPSVRQIGLTPRGWTRGTAMLGVLTALLAAVIASLGIAAGCIGQRHGMTNWIISNWYLEGVQQFLLQVLLVPRLVILLGMSGLAVSASAAVLFALLHLPNLPLTGLSLLGGILWCEWFRRYGNLVAVWVSHLVLGACVLYFLNGPTLHNLRVGVAYIISR